ncbi:MAG: hypothetical protein V4498_05160 [candidate division FCPU426 bacterium]
MKVILCLLLLNASLRADYGSAFIVDKAKPVRLERADQKIAYRFTAQYGGFLSTASVFCSEAQDPLYTKVSLYADFKGKPKGAALREAYFVPNPGAWSSLSMEGVSLTQGAVYHLVLEADIQRGGGHVVDLPASARWAAFGASSPLNHMVLASGEKDPASDTLFFDGKKWKALGLQPVFFLRHGSGQVEGDPADRPLVLPIDAKNQQAQVLHFSCDYLPKKIKLRLRRLGSGDEPLRFRLLENLYLEHRMAETSRGQIAATAVGREWSWVELPFDNGKKALHTECYYVAFSSDAAAGEGYELSAMQASAGLQQGADATFDAGAHRSRASSSEDGILWKDRFEADANVILTGPSCPVLRMPLPNRAPPLPSGDLRKAREVAFEALQASRRTVGDLQPGTAYRLEELANLDMVLGDWGTAVANLEKAVSIHLLSENKDEIGRLLLVLEQAQEKKLPFPRP